MDDPSGARDVPLPAAAPPAAAAATGSTGREGGPTLRAVRYDERFLERSWEWFQDEELRRLTMAPVFTREGQREWFERLPHRDDYLIWGVEADGVPIGAFGYRGVADGKGEYFSFIGEKAYWGGGIGTWMMTTAVDLGRERGLRRLMTKVSRENERARRLSLRCGYLPVEGGDEAVEILERDT